MAACIPADVPCGLDELDATTVSRLLMGSRSVPLAVLRSGRFVFANPAFVALFRAGGRLAGMALTDVMAARSQAAIGGLVSDPAETSATFRGRARRLDGSSFDAELLLARETIDGVPLLCVFAEDVTWQQLSEQNLIDLAYTDALTGLPNRALVMDRLRDAIVKARGADSGLAVCMADLDGLKFVNDTYGHPAGDVVLQVTARRFLGCIREGDILARLGGDEFCLLLPRVRDGRAAAAVAARLVEAARQPIPVGEHIVGVGASVGMALFPEHGGSGDALIAAADAALYEAKRGGRNRFALACAPESGPAASLPLIAWSAAHDVGIAMMDRQHRRLAEHLNDLAAGLRGGDDPSVLAGKVAALLSCTRHHFESEERLMQACGFADAPAHREAHAHLLEDLRNFAAGCDTRSLSLTTRFLQEWLLRHVDSADRALAAALKAGGVA
jgi:diguanylate cyclase (GGDEF)-like protein/hemerythrin-like metal-binding protein